MSRQSALFLVSSAALSLTLFASCKSVATSEAEPTQARRPIQGSLPTEQTFTSSATIDGEGQLGPGRGEILIMIKAPAGQHLTEGAPLKVQLEAADMKFPPALSTKLDSQKLPLRVPVEVADGATGPIEVKLSYYYCDDGSTASCRAERAHLILTADMSGPGEGGEVSLTHSPGLK
ncbi:MAG: hypothetical protein MK135_08055 [Polyangiaceae bacterium]|nr:hypothetical protein [Polyangiaceae bacterium]